MTKSERSAYMKEYRRKHSPRLRKYGRTWWKKHGWKENAKRRVKYHTNAEYRAAEIERKRKARENG